MPDASASAPVAGWYPDPDDAANDRWWDGSAWSQHRRPHTVTGGQATVSAPAPAASPAPAPQPMFAPAGAQPGYATGYAPVLSTQPPKNTIAMAGLIVGICSVPLILIGASFIAAVGGVTAGLLSGAGLTRARRLELAGAEKTRKRVAITGLVVGYGGGGVALVWTILSIIQFFANF